MELRRQFTGQRLTFASSGLIGTGGEARVYAVPAANTLVAKIYHLPE